MAAKITTQADDISLAATWVDGLPAVGDTCTLLHDCTLGTGKTFTAVSLDLGGKNLVVTGVATITANIIALETLDDSAATALTIIGNAATTVGSGWTCAGVTHITGTLVCNGTGGTNITGLTNTGTLTVDGGITATGTGNGNGIYNVVAAITGDCTGTATSGNGIYNESSTITGDCTGTATSGTGIYNDYGTINLIGVFAATSVSGQNLINTGTIQSVVQHPPALCGQLGLAL